jgi:hypothetical protein
MPKNNMEPVKSESVIIADTENGGRIVNGELIGPTLKVKRYIANSGLRCETLQEAREENLILALNMELHKAMDMTMVKSTLSQNDMKALIIKHGIRIKKVLQKKRYASILIPENDVLQEKWTAAPSAPSAPSSMPARNTFLA